MSLSATDALNQLIETGTQGIIELTGPAEQASLTCHLGGCLFMLIRALNAQADA